MPDITMPPNSSQKSAPPATVEHGTITVEGFHPTGCPVPLTYPARRFSDGRVEINGRHMGDPWFDFSLGPHWHPASTGQKADFRPASRWDRRLGESLHTWRARCGDWCDMCEFVVCWCTTCRAHVGHHADRHPTAGEAPQ